ncbi:MAG: hypothetical protein HY658_05490, partial [Actinobacteria bacterium]|nr:hypothetical protein [Actinomycetota bacterium]
MDENPDGIGTDEDVRRDEDAPMGDVPTDDAPTGDDVPTGDVPTGDDVPTEQPDPTIPPEG